MALQETPPPGWPHTEAEKYQTHIYPEVRPQEFLQPGKNMPAGSVEPPARTKGRGCGCLFTVLILIAIIGVAAAYVVPLLEGQGAFDSGAGTEESAAEEAFLLQYPTWDVEAVDRPDSEPLSVRIVAWDSDRNIGRIAFLDPVDGASSEYALRPITGEDSQAVEEAFLDAFAASWSDAADWTYIRFAQPPDGAADGGTWTVSYRQWDDETQEWSEIRDTIAEHMAGGVWYVVGPDSSEPTPQTEVTETP